MNESPTDKLIRELREENARLMEMIKTGGITLPTGGAGGVGAGGYSDAGNSHFIFCDIFVPSGILLHV